MVDQPERAFTKNDQGKPCLSMLFDMPRALVEVVKGLMYGAKKYTRQNWRKVDNTQRYIDAPLRHIMAYSSGEYIDEESNIPHLALAIDSLLFALQLEEEARHKRPSSAETLEIRARKKTTPLPKNAEHYSFKDLPDD